MQTQVYDKQQILKRDLVSYLLLSFRETICNRSQLFSCIIVYRFGLKCCHGQAAIFLFGDISRLTKFPV